MVANADYNTKVATMMAGSDYADLIWLNTSQLTIGGLPQFLKTAAVPELERFLRAKVSSEHLTLTCRLRCTFAMGNAISPRGDMPKNRVRLECKDAPCRRSNPFPLKDRFGSFL